MNPVLRGRVVVPAILSALVLVLAACGGSSSGGASAANSNSPLASSTSSTPACSLPAANAKATLPNGFPAPAGATFYQIASVGKTKVHFAYVAGSNVVTERDAIKAQLVAAGFTINGQDQEPGTEAELDADSAAHGGTLQVIEFCTGYLRLRFTLDH